jgi:transposase
MVLLKEEDAMAPYSMDLRTRVLRDWDAGMKAEAVAEKYQVSRAWVHRLQQRRRETGSIAPKKQTRWRTPILTAQLDELQRLITEQPDRTLAELQAALRTSACLTTIWRAIERLDITVKKNGARLRARSPGRGRRANAVAPRPVHAGSGTPGFSGRKRRRH